jgi:hypothetical protein
MKNEVSKGIPKAMCAVELFDGAELDAMRAGCDGHFQCSRMDQWWEKRGSGYCNTVAK